MNNNINISSIDERVKDFGKLAERCYKVPQNANFKLKDRTWPDKDISKAPTWCSVDLRDGNQSLRDPMTIEQKLEIFNLLVQMGFKEIEVGFPSASEQDYLFVRKLIEEDLIPDGVKIQVLIQCRDDLVERTRESLQGAKNVIVHIYNSTSTQQREIVFGKTKEEIIDLALEGVDLIKKYFQDFEGNLQLEYSPESFTGTEIEYAEEICKKVIDRWSGFGGNDIIINLPATVENSTPDRYADKIEYMSRQLNAYMEEIRSRVDVIISIHTHNDRGTGIAATELAIKAGADRVEGVIGVPNGERSGNIDISTVALNMFTHGVAPELDLSNIGQISEKISAIINIPIHPKYPYTGEVHVAFSGSHQDAIKKGLIEQEKKKGMGDEIWNVPYLPINPEHIGLEYTPIQINSQSGKGGTTFILDKLGYNIPKGMQKIIGQKIQAVTDKISGTLSEEEIEKIFIDNFVNINGPVQLDEFDFDQVRKVGREKGHGPIEELSNKISDKYGIDFRITNYIQHAKTIGKESDAISVFEIEYNGITYYGYGVDRDYEHSALHGLISAINIALRNNQIA